MTLSFVAIVLLVLMLTRLVTAIPAPPRMRYTALAVDPANHDLLYATNQSIADSNTASVPASVTIIQFNISHGQWNICKVLAHPSVTSIGPSMLQVDGQGSLYAPAFTEVGKTNTIVKWVGPTFESSIVIALDGTITVSGMAFDSSDRENCWLYLSIYDGQNSYLSMYNQQGRLKAVLLSSNSSALTQLSFTWLAFDTILSRLYYTAILAIPGGYAVSLNYFDLVNASTHVIVSDGSCMAVVDGESRVYTVSCQGDEGECYLGQFDSSGRRLHLYLPPGTLTNIIFYAVTDSGRLFLSAPWNQTIVEVKWDSSNNGGAGENGVTKGIACSVCTELSGTTNHAKRLMDFSRRE